MEAGKFRWCTLSWLLFLVCTTASATTASANGSTAVLSGSADAARAVILKALQEEFPGATIVGLSYRAGFVAKTDSMFAGKKEIFVGVVPMVSGTSMDISAFGVEIVVRPNKGDAQKIIESTNSRVMELSSNRDDISLIKEHTTYKTVPQRVSECLASLASDVEIVDLVGKIAVHQPQRPTLQMLVDSTKPTEAEKNQIAAWAAKKDQCIDLRKQHAAYYPADARLKMYLECNDKWNELILDLFKGNTTYGEYSTKSRQLVNDYLQRMAELAIKLQKDDQDAQARQADIERKYAVESQKLNIESQKASATQRAADALTFPKQRCTTRIIGNIKTTQCQ